MADDVEVYLAALPDTQRKVLEELRSIIRSAAPEAEERLSYRVPTFFHQGGLVAMSASKGHCGFHLMSPPTMEAFKEDLKGFKTTTATVHLQWDEPLPSELIVAIVRARVEENISRHR